MINSVSTARQAAIHLIKRYVERGDSFEILKASFLEHSCSYYKASIGGFINQKWVSTKFVVVCQLHGQNINPKIFELKELYDFLKEKQNLSLLVGAVTTKLRKRKTFS